MSLTDPALGRMATPAPCIVLSRVARANDELRFASLCVTPAGPRASRFASLLPANHPAQHRKPPGQPSFAGRYRVMRASQVRTAPGSRRQPWALRRVSARARTRAGRLARALRQAPFLRPYNNGRFHPGPPLKEHLGIAIGYTAPGGSYLELSLDGLLVAAGLHHPATDQLQRVRAAIDDHRRATAFERTVVSAEAGGLKLAQPAIKRAPRGYRVDHPRIEWLRLRNLTISHRHRIDSWLNEPICRERVQSQLRAAQPFVAWIAETVGPPTRPRSSLNRG